MYKAIWKNIWKIDDNLKVTAEKTVLSSRFKHHDLKQLIKSIKPQLSSVQQTPRIHYLTDSIGTSVSMLDNYGSSLL